MEDKIIIRLETKNDYYFVENLTREAFWNIYSPGCSEHLVLHNFRTSPNFIKELDYVITLNNVIIAHIMYTKAYVDYASSKKEVLMFGPISVDPQYQKKGFGSMIINYTLDKAKKLGYKAVVITGNPDYYHRFGFISASKYNVHYMGMPLNDEVSFFMAKELQPNYFDFKEGIFAEPDEYHVSETELEEFEKNFPSKIKEKKPWHLS